MNIAGVILIAALLAIQCYCYIEIADTIEEAMDKRTAKRREIYRQEAYRITDRRQLIKDNRRQLWNWYTKGREKWY